MKISHHRKPQALGVVIVELPPKRDPDELTGSFAYSHHKGEVLCRVPVQLDHKDTCEHPEIFFAKEALNLARGEVEKDVDEIDLPIGEKVQTLEAEFEIHRPDPKNNEVPTISAMARQFPDEIPDPLFAVNVAHLAKASKAIGNSNLVLHFIPSPEKEKPGLLLVRSLGEHNNTRQAEAMVVTTRVPIEQELPLEDE